MTPAQRKIARIMLSSGASNRKIGRELGVREATVKAQMQKMFNETGMRTRVEFAMHILRNPRLLFHVYETEEGIQ